MKRTARYLSTWILVMLVWLVTASFAVAQCPMCKAAVESGTGYGEQESWLASMLNTGIIYLFTLPYLAIMGVSILWYRGYRRRKREEAQASMTTIESVLGENSGSVDENPS